MENNTLFVVYQLTFNSKVSLTLNLSLFLLNSEFSYELFIYLWWIYQTQLLMNYWTNF